MFRRPTNTQNVTESEFVKAMMADGKSEVESKLQAIVCRTLGSAVPIGVGWYSVNKGTVPSDAETRAAFQEAKKRAE